MTHATFGAPKDSRYLEDYVPGTTHEFGEVELSEAELIEFALRYDPQDKHADPVAAAKGPFGGLIASGWQTAGLMMRLYARYYLSDAASIASPGVDELRWIKPVRPGDRLRIRVTVLEAKPSRSKPDRGVLRSSVAVVNQNDEVVMTLIAMNMMFRRNHT
jgi:acyl dehydratase